MSYQVISCIWSNFKNIEIFGKDFIQNSYYRSMFIALFLHDFKDLIQKSHKSITITGSFEKP